MIVTFSEGSYNTETTRLIYSADWFLDCMSLSWNMCWKIATSSFKVSMKIPTPLSQYSRNFSIARLWLVSIMYLKANFYRPLVNICIPVAYIGTINILLKKPYLFFIEDLFKIFPQNFLWVSNGVTTIFFSNSMSSLYSILIIISASKPVNEWYHDSRNFQI